MTDLRPRLPRDRDGIAIDALAIHEGRTIEINPGESYQIGPYDSDVIVRIVCLSTASVVLSPSNDPDTTNTTVIRDTTERFRLYQGDSLYAFTSGHSVHTLPIHGSSGAASTLNHPAVFNITILK